MFAETHDWPSAGDVLALIDSISIQVHCRKRIVACGSHADARLSAGDHTGADETQCRLAEMTCLLTAGCPTPSSRATAEKLPLSTTRTNILIASSRSMNFPATLPHSWSGMTIPHIEWLLPRNGNTNGRIYGGWPQKMGRYLVSFICRAKACRRSRCCIRPGRRCLPRSSRHAILVEGSVPSSK